MTDLPPALGAIVELPPRGRPHLAPFWAVIWTGAVIGSAWTLIVVLIVLAAVLESFGP